MPTSDLLRSRAATPRVATRQVSPWALAWCATLPIALLRASQLAESDTFWEIRTGLYMIAHHVLPAADPFSWTVRGEPWTLNSWGFDLILAVLYRAGGLALVAFGCGAAVAAVSGLALLLARKFGAAPLPSAFLLIATSPIQLAYYSARPALADYCGVLILLWLLSNGHWSGHRKAVLLFAVTTVWVNLHSGALIALPLVAVVSAVALARRRNVRSVVEACSLVLATFLGLACNPYGVGVITQGFAVRAASAEYVLEWQRFDFTSPVQVVALLLGLTALAVAIRARNWIAVPALVILLVGGAMAVRIQPMLTLAALPVLSTAISRKRRVVEYLASRRRVWYLGLAALACVSLAGVIHPGRPQQATYPGESVMSAIPRGCRLFNTYLVGGYVMLMRPDVPVYIDSRNDLYGVARLDRYEAIMGGKQPLDAASCALVPPGSELDHRLGNDPSWRRIDGDQAANLYRKTESPTSAASADT